MRPRHFALEDSKDVGLDVVTCSELDVDTGGFSGCVWVTILSLTMLYEEMPDILGTLAMRCVAHVVDMRV